MEMALRNESIQAELQAVIVPMVQAGIRKNFDMARGPDGRAWPPRKNPGDGHPLLIDTGALVKSVTKRGPGGILKVRNRSVLIGTDGVNSDGGIRAAAIHNRGGSNMPQREFMGLDDETLDEIGETIADFFMEKIG